MGNFAQLDALRRALAKQDTSAARALLIQMHSTDIAETIVDMLPGDAAALLLALPVRRQAETFEHLDSATQNNVARYVDARSLAALLTEMSHNKRADFFKQLGAAERDALLPAIAHVEREDIRRLSAYPEGTAGSIMTSAYAALKPGLTAQEAIETLRRESLTKETIYHIYVVDDARALLGVVSLRELVVADGSARVSDLMQRTVISVLASESTESVVEAITDYDLLALPIVNENKMLVGIVKVSDAMEVVESERGRNVAQFGGNAPVGGGADLSLRDSSFMRIFSVRAFWLAILTVFGVVTSTFVAAQEEILEQVVLLAAFIAPIIDSGGNTGSQSATLVIRSMTLGEVKLRWRDVWFVIRREMPIALLLGVIIAILEVVLAFMSKGVGVEILLIVGTSMLLCMASGGIIGALLPFAARRLGTDPAALSAPLITSIMDLLGVFIYFGMAYYFLGDMLTGG